MLNFDVYFVQWFQYFSLFFFVLIHNSISNGCPCRQDITHENIFVDRLYSFQESCCKGNVVLNVWIKDVLAVKNCSSPKDLDATSAILFCLPYMWVARSGEAYMISCLVTNALSRCAAIIDIVAVWLLVQDTVAALSQKIPM